ncbi:MAG: D-alanine--D-alanine ligase family protein [Solirubrobacterales bacterium]
MRVVVLSGGRSSEHDVSLDSGASVANGLAEAGHEPVPVLIARNGRWTCAGAPVTLEPGAGLLGADAAFPVLHGPFGEDGTIQGLLEYLDIPYVGPGVLAAAVTLDKLVFKRLCAFAGLPQVEFCEVGEEGWREAAMAMPRPLWVKPSRLGSSVGISKVSDPDAELDAAVEAARRHDPRVIVEAHGAGAEVECSVMGNDDPQVSVPGQLGVNAEWYDYEAKYSDGGMDLVVPAPISEEATQRVGELARRAFTLVGATGLARCDFFVRDDGEVLVNEINTIPGFTATSVFAKLFEASGVPYAEVCDRLVELAIERHRRERGYAF